MKQASRGTRIKPASADRRYDHSNRVRSMYRLIELPLLLQRREYTQSELTRLYEIDRKTLKSDLRIIAEYYPVRERKSGRHVYYWIDAGVRPKLKRIGAAPYRNKFGASK